LIFACLLVLGHSGSSASETVPTAAQEPRTETHDALADDVEGSTIPLLQLVQVTDIAGDIGEGGFDARIKSGKWLAATLADCAMAIDRVGRGWAQEHELAVINSRLEEGRSVLHLGARDLSGYFEILYQFRSKPTEAIASCHFIDQAGSAYAVELLDFENYDLEQLADRLKEAMECSAAE
jgi:hypothetical protein